jgi:hypothetical protein
MAESKEIEMLSAEDRNEIKNIIKQEIAKAIVSLRAETGKTAKSKPKIIYRNTGNNCQY